jgi:hypothetical protein
MIALSVRAQIGADANPVSSGTMSARIASEVDALQSPAGSALGLRPSVAVGRPGFPTFARASWPAPILLLDEQGEWRTARQVPGSGLGISREGASVECFVHAGRRAVAICANCRHGLCQSCGTAADSSGTCAECQRTLPSARKPTITLTRLDDTCYRHSAPSVGLCARCSRPICRDCATLVEGRSTCRECASLTSASAAPGPQRADGPPPERSDVSRTPIASAVRAPRPIGRRDVLGLIGVAWAGAFGYSLLRATETHPKLRVDCVAQLQPWLEDVLTAEPRLRDRIDVRTALRGGPVSADAAAIGLPADAGDPTPGAIVIASSPYVVAVWEDSRIRAGLSTDGPVDWTAVRSAVARGPSRWTPPPMETTLLGADGLAVLAAGYYGSGIHALPADAATDTGLHEWLQPFYVGPRRSDEQAHMNLWPQQLSNLGDAGLLPEYEAIKLIRAVQPRARLHVRYPVVGLSRQFVLVPPASDDSYWSVDRLRRALLSPSAQLDLASHDLRPVVPVVAPPSNSPFVTLRQFGVRWPAHPAELPRDEAYRRLVAAWLEKSAR